MLCQDFFPLSGFSFHMIYNTIVIEASILMRFHSFLHCQLCVRVSSKMVLAQVSIIVTDVLFSFLFFLYFVVLAFAL